jgi:hypothetical protein
MDCTKLGNAGSSKLGLYSTHLPIEVTYWLVPFSDACFFQVMFAPLLLCRNRAAALTTEKMNSERPSLMIYRRRPEQQEQVTWWRGTGSDREWGRERVWDTLMFSLCWKNSRNERQVTVSDDGDMLSTV